MVAIKTCRYGSKIYTFGMLCWLDLCRLNGPCRIRSGLEALVLEGWLSRGFLYACFIFLPVNSPLVIGDDLSNHRKIVLEMLRTSFRPFAGMLKSPQALDPVTTTEIEERGDIKLTLEAEFGH